MNIKEAKQQIKNAMKSYFTKDEFGNHFISIVRQRPVFLMGPPGIGKTAIMEQIAYEMGVGLVSYSMTHHTRQSALGLPFIERKTYGGKEYDISEYTMSEIIASVYDVMEETNVKEGILFLDEINCVSETLAPSMLQFLQYKIFGRHQIPEGWIVVTAGNPAEYNNSVREFDIVTWDRLKRIDVEPDYDVWKEYAYKKGNHPAIMTYLEIKKGDFYKVETTVDGKSFVTARGWDDLSQIIILYEKLDIQVDVTLISQYLQNSKTAKEFALYYDLFNKYRSDYQIGAILDGRATEEIKNRAMVARFDERLSLLGLLFDGIMSELRYVITQEELLLELRNILKNVKVKLSKENSIPIKVINREIEDLNAYINNKKKSSSLSDEEQRIKSKLIMALEEMESDISYSNDDNEAFDIIKANFNERVKSMKQKTKDANRQLSNLFIFCEETFKEGQELLILVTELTISYYSAKYISKYGSDEYFKHNKELLFYERQKEIIEQLENIEAMS